MESKVIVITGASGAIGAAAAKRLSTDGHQVIVVGCSPSKTEAVAREIGSDFYVADFTKLAEVHTLAERLLEKYPRIDVLANNAGGVFSRERRLTPDGHQITFQVNYLAGFLLTTRLLDRLIESHATVIFTSCHANRLGHIDLDDLENGHDYSVIKAYGDSKLAQNLFARELHRRYGQSGLATAAFHPGNITSNFSGERGTLASELYHTPLRHLWTASPKKGAHTLVFLAEGRPGVDFPSGKYFYKRKIDIPNKQAYNRALARILWNRSENMIESFCGHTAGVSSGQRHW